MPLGVELLLPDDEPEVPELPDVPDVLDVLGVLGVLGALDEPDVPEVSDEPDDPDEPDVPDVSAAPEPDGVEPLLPAPLDDAPLLPDISAGFCFVAFAPCFLACLCLRCGFFVSMPLSELLVPVVA